MCMGRQPTCHLVSMEYVCKFMLAIDGGRDTGLQWNSQIRSGFV